MPTSSADQVYVWAFLPDRDVPVVAGVLFPSVVVRGLAFQYGRSFLENPDAISLGPDLPLRAEPFTPVYEHGMPSSIRDAMPDSWGRIVIQRRAGLDAEAALPDVQYMLESGSDRVGGIDFQASSSEYVPRLSGATLRDTAAGAGEVEADSSAGSNLDEAVRNSLSSAGGSQPKAFVSFDGLQWLAKFPTQYDKTSPLIKAERAAIYIAREAGIEVPDARMVNVPQRGPTLLVKRFDRPDGRRRFVVSGHTVSGQHASSGESYPVLVREVKALSRDPGAVGRDLFTLLAFRIAMRIDDDHLRNIATFWDGRHAEFTPAFDLSPDLVSTPSGLTDIGDGVREFSLATLVTCHYFYDLSQPEASAIAERVVEQVVRHRQDAAEAAMMSRSERELLLTRTATPELIGELSRQGAPSTRSVPRPKAQRGARPGQPASPPQTPPEANAPQDRDVTL